MNQPPNIFLILISIIFLLIPIYCVYKMAAFKKRNRFIWTVLALLFSFPIAFLLISFLPSKQTADEKNDYLKNFSFNPSIFKGLEAPGLKQLTSASA